jgi:hypothetical protein
MGGHLQPDPARADGHHLAGAAQRGPQVLAVAHPAQVRNAFQVSARRVEAARGRAGGQQQPVVGHGPAVGQGHLPGAWVQRGRPHAEPQVHAVVGVPGLLVHVDGRPVLLAEQVSLGQRRAFVGALVLLPQQHDVPVEPLLPEGFRGLGTGQARADYHVRGLSGHQKPLPHGRRTRG